MQRISVQCSWGLEGIFGIFQVFELEDGLDPIIDTDRTPPVYGIVGNVPFDGKKVDEYLAPIGNAWTLLKQDGTRRYYLLHNQPSETAYIVFDGLSCGEGANMMQAAEMLKYNAENPTWQA